MWKHRHIWDLQYSGELQTRNPKEFHTANGRIGGEDPKDLLAVFLDYTHHGPGPQWQSVGHAAAEVRVEPVVQLVQIHKAPLHSVRMVSQLPGICIVPLYSGTQII